MQTVRYLHGAGLYHGNLSPDCFRLLGLGKFHDLSCQASGHCQNLFPTGVQLRFHSDRAHAPLKLVDFGLDLKAISVRVAFKRLRCAYANGLQIKHPTGQGPVHNSLRLCFIFPPCSAQACRLVFWAPEVFKRIKATERSAEDLRSPDLAPSWLSAEGACERKQDDMLRSKWLESVDSESEL